MVDTEELSLKLKKTRHVRKGHRSSVTRSLAVARELVEKARNEGINVEAQCQLSAPEEKLGSKAALLRKLDEEILDLTIEVDEDKFEEEVLSADAYDEEVSCALKAIAGVLRDRPTSGTGAMQRVDLKTDASPVPCDDQALDFEEGDQPDGPADISTMRASVDQGRDPSHGLRRGQGPQVKLPKLELRKFSGKPMEWQPVLDTFCSLWIWIKKTFPTLDRFNESIECNGGQYFIDLPWKEVHPTRCMKKILRSSPTTEEELLTLLLEEEATLNSRPLTYVSTKDVREPLTPSHLLCGFRVLSLPDRPSEKIDDVSFGRRYAYLQRLLSQFWTRWQKDYLLELRNSHRLGTTGSGDAASVGDVVVVHRAARSLEDWRH